MELSELEVILECVRKEAPTFFLAETSARRMMDWPTDRLSAELREVDTLPKSLPKTWLKSALTELLLDRQLKKASGDYFSLDRGLGKIVAQTQKEYLADLFREQGKEKILSLISGLANPCDSCQTSQKLCRLSLAEENYQFLKRCDPSLRDEGIEAVKAAEKEKHLSFEVVASFFNTISRNYDCLREISPKTRKKTLVLLINEIRSKGELVGCGGELNLDKAIKKSLKRLRLEQSEYEQLEARISSLIGDYSAHSKKLGQEISEQICWYRQNSCLPGMLDRVTLPNADFHAAKCLTKFYQEKYPHLKNFEPDLALIIAQKIGTSLKEWKFWPFGDIEEMTKNLLQFGTEISSSAKLEIQKGLLDFLGNLILSTKPKREFSTTPAPKKYWDQVMEISGSYLSLLKIQQSKKNFGQRLMEEIATRTYFPLPNPESGLMELKDEEYFQKRAGKKTFPPLGSIFDRAVKLKTLCDLYSQYLAGKEIEFPPADLAVLVADFSEKSDFLKNKIETLFRILSGQQCQTLEEVAECAEMNLRLKDTGYEVVKKIGPGTYKEVYLARDRFGRRGALKRIDPQAEAAVREKGLSLQEMLSRDLIINPFDLKHPNVCSTLPVCTPEETFILEELYELTLEDFLKQMHSSGRFAARSVDITNLEMEPQVSSLLYHIPLNVPITPKRYLKSLSGMRNDPATTLLFPYSELILDLVTQLVAGLQACHQKGIVHADLKTNNIGIKNDLTVVLSDFGMATLDQGIRARKDPCSVYIRDIKLLEPNSRPDWRSDYWAVGSILYRLCTGRFPFSQEPAAFSEKEREEYIQTMQKAYHQGNWREILQENLRNFLPGGFEIGNFILDGKGKIVGKDVFLEPCLDNPEIMEKIKAFLQMCFRLSGKEITIGPSFLEDCLTGIGSELEHLKRDKFGQTVKVQSLDKVRKYFKEADRTEIVKKDSIFRYRVFCSAKEFYSD